MFNLFRKKDKWLKVLKLSELCNWENGQLKTAQIKGKRLCLAKYENQYFAVKDKCPHAGGSLSHGKLTANGEIECPLHRFKFSCKTGENTSGEGFFALPFTVEEREDGLYVKL